MPTLMIARDSSKEPISFDEFLGRFDACHLDRVETAARRHVEGYVAPARIENTEEFCAACVQFHQHYLHARFGIPMGEPVNSFTFIWVYFDLWYGGKRQWYEVSRLAQTGHDGGFVTFLHDITAGMVRQDIESYIDNQCRYYVPDGYGDNQYQMRERLVDELLRRFGHVAFFPHDPYISPAIARACLITSDSGPNGLRPLFKALVLRLRGLQQQVQF